MPAVKTDTLTFEFIQKTPNKQYEFYTDKPQYRALGSLAVAICKSTGKSTATDIYNFTEATNGETHKWYTPDGEATNLREWAKNCPPTRKFNVAVKFPTVTDRKVIKGLTGAKLVELMDLFINLHKSAFELENAFAPEEIKPKTEVGHKDADGAY